MVVVAMKRRSSTGNFALDLPVAIRVAVSKVKHGT